MGQGFRKHRLNVLTCLQGSVESDLFLALLFLLSGNVSNGNAIGRGVCVVSLC